MLSKTDLDAFVNGLLGADITVIAPVRREQGDEKVEYRPVHSPAEILFSGPPPVRPLKEVVFPPTEPLFNWKQTKSSIQIEEVTTKFKDTVVIGARPCDAAAFEIVDKVMGWDYHDELWFGRRQAVTVLSVACSQSDDSCFCTAVGLSPESTRGADWFMIPVDGGFEIEVLTPKGEKLLERCKDRCHETARRIKETPSLDTKVRANLNINPGKVREWLEKHFDDPLWKSVALRCHGCGACAFVCPTCHCFDIVDELEGIGQGQRRRNWDACQPALFTLHGSGHNPRKDQGARFRQRIMHKFNIYPARFGEILCTGCGRCIRACAAGMDLIAILAEIDRKSAEEGQ
jgi:ferredoxin